MTRGEAQPLEAGRGEQHAVPALALELAEPGVHVPTDRLDNEVGSQRQRQRAAARAPGAEARTRAQVLEAGPLPGHEDVAGVLSLGKRREAEARWNLRRQVLETVHGAIEGAGEEHLLDLPHEEPLPADRRQLDLEAAITLGPYRHDLDGGAQRPQRGRDALRLDQRERAPPSSDRDRCGWLHFRPSPKSSWTSSSHERGEPARDRSRSDTIVGITSTSPSLARNFATSRSTSASARCASRRRSRMFASTTCFRSSTS